MITFASKAPSRPSSVPLESHFLYSINAFCSIAVADVLQLYKNNSFYFQKNLFMEKEQRVSFGLLANSWNMSKTIRVVRFRKKNKLTMYVNDPQ